MKNLLFFLLCGVLVLFTACGDDDAAFVDNSSASLTVNV